MLYTLEFIPIVKRLLFLLIFLEKLYAFSNIVEIIDEVQKNYPLRRAIYLTQGKKFQDCRWWTHIGVRPEEFSRDIKLLMEALKENLYVKQITFYEYNIDTISAETIENALKTGIIYIKKLVLNSCVMNIEELEKIVSALPYTQIKSLDLINNSLGDDGAKAIALVLPYVRLVKLNLQKNGISDTGARILLEALKNNMTLTELDLKDNSVSREYLQMVNRQLAKNKNIARRSLLKEASPPQKMGRR